MGIKDRILIITPFCSPSVGGAETHLEDFYEYLRMHGYFVYVLTYQPITINKRGLPLEKKKNLEIRRFSWFGHNLFYQFEKLPPVFNFIYLTFYLLLRSFIFLLFHRNKVDIIHAQGLNAAVIAAILKKLFKKKAYMSTMALYSFKKDTFFSKITSFVLNNLDKVFVESLESKKEIISIGVPKEKIVLFSHWVNGNKFRPIDKNRAKGELGWGNRFIVLFVGRAIPLKGGDTLTRVIGKINSDITIAVISDAGPQLELFKQTSQKYPNFLFLGGIAYEDLYKYYQAADIFIIPSRYEEGAARVMMEAVSCGTPVIASNRGAIPSILNSSVAVFVNPNEAEIKQAIEHLYNNKQKLGELTRKCTSFAKEHFGSANAKVFMQNYSIITEK